jgi:3-methylcrotonyl-CoA carboxylase alpha subunit
MNTRLQVEHPVTEEVTGLDLVEWQLRVAAGERLPLRQSEIKMGGHAIEVRICAEDPSENFRPSVGRLVRCRWPLEQDAAGEKIRLDCGFEQGDAIPSAYDSMIGKLIVRARSDHARTTAIQVLRRALGDFEALGVTTNAHFLLQCLAPEGAFAAGDHHVGTVGADMDVLTDPAASLRRAACLLVRSEIEAASGDGPWSAMDGWRLNAAARARWTLETGQGQLVIDRVGDHLTIEDRSLALPSAEAARGKVHRHGGTNVVFADGGAFAFAPAGASADQADAAASDDVKAPLPGKIVSVSAVVGAHVKKGDPLVVLEAMKMEHTLGAPRDGAIAEVLVQTGVQTGEGAVLVRLSPVEA